MLLRTETITCPACQTPGNFTIYPSINTTMDFSLREKVLSGDLFLYTCPNCHHVTNISYPVLYHDMASKYMVQMVKDKNEDPFGQTMPLIKAFGKDYKYRKVTSYTDLVTTIVAFDYDLDDRIIQLMITLHLKELTDMDKEVLDYALTVDDDKNPVFVYQLQDQVAEIPFSQENYNIYADAVKFENDGNFQCVDLEWILENAPKVN